MFHLQKKKKLDGWRATAFTSYNRFSIEYMSGLWLDQSHTFPLCLGHYSAGWWTYAPPNRLSSIIALYSSTRLAVISDWLPVFTVEVVRSCGHLVFSIKHGHFNAFSKVYFWLHLTTAPASTCFLCSLNGFMAKKKKKIRKTELLMAFLLLLLPQRPDGWSAQQIVALSTDSSSPSPLKPVFLSPLLFSLQLPVCQTS